MMLGPNQIFNEYHTGVQFKSAIGSKGIFEQSRINERFFIGDQWYGAKCGNDRPLVRHNIIKRIGDYKMSQILNNPITVMFSSEGVPTNDADVKFSQSNGDILSVGEINSVMSAFDDYYSVTAERVNLNSLCEKILRNAYISGTAILYTYWDSSVNTGLYADSHRRVKIKGDISCEVLGVEDIVFGDPYTENIQQQPFIIISSRQDIDLVLRETRLDGADLSTLTAIAEAATDGKITVLTRLYKVYNSDGSYTIKSVKAVENAIVRKEFDTGLRLYPLSVFRWENKNNCVYGESEITYLIPNQIAINRMITANVWSAMTTGMPIMVVNGDTVSSKITNDPGQIIKVYGSNEDVAGAIKYVTPPSYLQEFDNSINSLINNTLTQSGANEVALGDSKAENATALITMRDSALMPLQIIKSRYYTFIEDIARIWADFWITHYGKRQLKSLKNGESRYILFDADRYRELIVNTKVDVSSATVYSEKERLDTLITLFDKGVISKNQFLERIPDGMISDLNGLKTEQSEVGKSERI